MDMEQFEVETEKPVFVQFNNPFNGSLLFDKKTDESGQIVDDEEKPVGVMLFGQDSKAFLDRQRQLLDKKVAEAQKTRNPKAVKIDDKELSQSNRDTVKACIHSFVNITWQGESLGEQRDKFDAFLVKHPWAFQQCNSAIMDRANFQKALLKS